MKHTISILVENHAGVLSRISGLFSRRGFNIDSLAVGVTDNPFISRITVVVNGDDYTVEQVEKQLNKLIDVIKLKRLPQDDMISKEFMMVKVHSVVEKHAQLSAIAQIAGAKICDQSDKTTTFELANTSEQVDLFLKQLDPFHILEVVRTGTIALGRGSNNLTI